MDNQIHSMSEARVILTDIEAHYVRKAMEYRGWSQERIRFWFDGYATIVEPYLSELDAPIKGTIKDGRFIRSDQSPSLLSVWRRRHSQRRLY